MSILKPFTSSRALLAGVALAAASLAAQAAVVFDNFKGTGAENYVEETRNAEFTFGAVLNSLTTQTIDEIQLRWRPNNDMDVTLFIWDSELAGTFGSLNWTPTGNNVRLSVTQSVAGSAGAVDYLLVFSGLNFTFEADHRYDIGILGSSGTLTGSWDIQNGFGNINTVMGNFESINRNSNNSSGRSDDGYAGVDPHIRLISADGRIPEPATLALIGLALAAAGVSRRRSGR